jgi:hypothetical protein
MGIIIKREGSEWVLSSKGKEVNGYHQELMGIIKSGPGEDTPNSITLTNSIDQNLLQL